MKKHNIATSILSVTAPGACILSGDESFKLARRLNEFAAKMRDSAPESYGFFANLPDLFDKDAALAEIEYAFDTLKADGVVLFTRYGNEHAYLGHAAFRDIWAELDRRNAVVFVHPTHPVDTGLVNPLLPQPVMDYAFETTKTAVDLIISKNIRIFKNVKIILSHAGGVLPYLMGRPASIVPAVSAKHNADQMLEDAREFYYDTALSGSPNQLLLVKDFVKPGHLLFGSDFPYAPPASIDYHIEGLDKYPFEKEGLLDETNYKNGMALIPRLARSAK